MACSSMVAISPISKQKHGGLVSISQDIRRGTETAGMSGIEHWPVTGVAMTFS